MERDGRIPRRREDVLSRRVGDEVVLYDNSNDTAHLLNPPAALIWDHLDEATSFEDLVHVVSQEQGGSSATEITALALEELLAAGVASGRVPTSGLSRRTVLKGLGAAAVVLPAVLTLKAPPTAAAGASTLCVARACGSTNQCLADGNCTTVGRSTCCAVKTSPLNNTCVTSDNGTVCVA